MNPIQFVDMIHHYNLRAAQIMEELYDCKNNMRQLREMIDTSWNTPAGREMLYQLEVLIKEQSIVLEEAEQARKKLLLLEGTIDM